MGVTDASFHSLGTEQVDNKNWYNWARGNESDEPAFLGNTVLFEYHQGQMLCHVSVYAVF